MKLRSLQKILTEKKIDLAFFTHPDPTITYFLRAKTSYAFFLVRPRSAKIYVSKLDSIIPPKGITLHYFKKKWKKELFNAKIKKIGIEKGQLTLSFFETLKKVYPKAKFVDITLDIQHLRQIKTNLEIKYISKACKLTDFALREFIDAYKSIKFPTEQSVALFLEKNMRNSGGGIAFPTIVGSGVNSSVPHHETSTKPLKKGFLQLDFGASFKHYCADMSRVLYLGIPSKKEKEDFELLFECQRATRDYVREGMAFGELDAYSRKKLGKRASYFVHSLGHGIGIEVHEAPKVGADSKETIMQNSVFTIEPGIYIPHKYGIRIEDTVLFLRNKVKVLTSSPRELILV